MKTNLDLEKWLREKKATKEELIDSASKGGALAIRSLLQEHWNRVLSYALEDPRMKTDLTIRLEFHLEPSENKVNAQVRFRPPSFSAGYSGDLGNPAQMKFLT